MRNVLFAIVLTVLCSIWYVASWRPMLLSGESGITSTEINQTLRESKQQLAIAKKRFMAFTKAKRLYTRIKEWTKWLLGEEMSEKIQTFTTEQLSQYLKLYVSFLQVVSSFITFPVAWPSLFLNTMVWIKGTLFLDILQLPILSCLWVGINFQHRLLAYTLVPLVVIVLFVVPVVFALVAGYKKKKNPSWVAVLDSAWKNIIFWTFLVYPIVSLTTLQAFDCQPEGLNRLAADYSQKCPDDTHMTRVWSIIFIVIYPVGIPLFCLLAMLRMGVHLVAQDKYDFNILSAMVAKYSQLTTSIESRRIAAMFRVGGVVNGELDEEIKKGCAALLDINGKVSIGRLKGIKIAGIDPHLMIKLVTQKSNSYNAETEISFEIIRDLIRLEKEIRRVYTAMFDSGGEFKRVTSKDFHLMGVEAQSMLKFFQVYDKNKDKKISLNEFRDMALNVMETTSLFTGVEGDRLTKGQAVALLMFDWKSAVTKAGEDDEFGFGDGEQEESQLDGNAEEEDSSKPDRNDAKDSQDNTVVEMESDKENDVEKNFKDEKGEEEEEEEEDMKTSDIEDENIKKKRERILREACDKCKHKVSAEIWVLAQSLVDDKVISVPDMVWPSSSALEILGTSDGVSTTQVDPREQGSKDLEDFVIHPDLADDYRQKTVMSSFVNFISSGSFHSQESWSTVNKRKELEEKALKRVGFVFSAYKSNLWYWEMIEMLRK